METPEKKTGFPIAIVVGGACSLLLTLACIASVILVLGGLLMRTRSSGEAQVKAQEATFGRSLSESQSPAEAQLQDVRGWVEVQDEAGNWSPAVEGQSVSAGQHVRTGELSGVTLAFYDGSRASLKASGEITIDELDAQKSGSPRTIILTQAAGESTHEVAPNHEEGSSYLVNSPSGAGEAKGTVFTVVVTPDHAAYYSVVEGIVAVTSMDVTVLVNAGEFTTLFFEQPPSTPVLSVSGEGQLTQTGDSWTIAEQVFVVSENTVITGEPQVGDWVHVQGHLGPDGANVADWIILLRASPANRFSITGVIEAFGEGVWTVNGQSILIVDTTEYDEMAQVGDIVRIHGLILEDGRLQAVEIELANPPAGMPFSFTGVVEETGENLWVVSGTSILIGEDTTMAEELAAGAVVRVTGWIQEDGRWLAKSIVLLDDSSSDFSFTGVLEQVDPWVAAGIGFEVRDWTLIDEGLETGMLVRVEGEINDEGEWVASKVERIDDDEVSTLVLIGTVVSVDPWVVSGIPLVVTDATQIIGQVTAGTLVRVQVVLAADGTWQVISIQALDQVSWFPGCMDIVATVVSVSGNQIKVLNWPALTLAEGAQVEGEITPNSVVRFRVCFTEAQIIEIRYIVIIQPGEIEVEVPGDGGEKVTICHKPGKKGGGKTMTVSRSALGGHLGHGDYEGSCR